MLERQVALQLHASVTRACYYYSFVITILAVALGVGIATSNKLLILVELIFISLNVRSFVRRVDDILALTELINALDVIERAGRRTMHE